MIETRTEWAFRCECNPANALREVLNSAVGDNEGTAPSHVQQLRENGHPAKLYRRTITYSDWQETTDD